LHADKNNKIVAVDNNESQFEEAKSIQVVDGGLTGVVGD